MATASACANQDFNITNGDLFRWSNRWPKFADYFGMASRPVETVNLADYMTDKEAVWQRVIEGHTLIPQSLEQVAIWSYWCHLSKPDWDIVSSRTKARQFGFHASLIRKRCSSVCSITFTSPRCSCKRF